MHHIIANNIMHNIIANNIMHTANMLLYMKTTEDAIIFVS